MERRKASRVPSTISRLGCELRRRRLLLHILFHVSCYFRAPSAVHYADTTQHSPVPGDETGTAEKTEAFRQVLQEVEASQR
jgi:hypothetical protein